MAYWRATNAKAKFSGLLDAAESEGPQLIHRRQQTFVVTTEAEVEQRIQEAREGSTKKFVSSWDALRPSFDRRYDIEFPRLKGTDAPKGSMAEFFYNSPLRGSGIKIGRVRLDPRPVEF